MWFPSNVVAIVLVQITIITCVNCQNFVVPEPEIIAYRPKGLEISIPDEEGIILFAIHANINHEMRYLEAGELSQDVTKKTGNRWVYKNKNVRLKVGDKLYYWLFVIKDGLGYRRDDITHVIEELVPLSGHNAATSARPWRTKPTPTTTSETIILECSTRPSDSLTTPPTITRTTTTTMPTTPSTVPIVITTPRVESTTSVHLALCEQTLTSVTQKLLSLTNALEEMRETNAIMKDIIEIDPDGRKLKLIGNLPDNDEPESIVRQILESKYSLQPKILTAYQGKNNSITFEVKLEDKISIIRRQRELAKRVTSVKIVYEM